MSASIDGYNLSQGGEQPVEAMSSSEFDEMLERNRDWIVSAGIGTVQ